MSEHDLAETARTVVGPDEALGAHSPDDMETNHWNTVAEELRAHGVAVDSGELKQLPHDVVLSDGLLARLGESSGGAA
jgi:hypothetical protein